MKRLLAVVAAVVVVLVVQRIQAQKIQTQRDGNVNVRAIAVTPDRLLPQIPFATIQNAWKEDGIGLKADLRITPESLSELATRADRTIQRVYGNVLVEHQITELPPTGSVELHFDVGPVSK